jgi:cytochrome P450
MTTTTATVDPDLEGVDLGVMPNSPVQIDVHGLLGPLREERGVIRAKMGDEITHVLLRYEDCRLAVRDETQFSKREAFVPLTFPVMGPNLMGYEGKEHSNLRGLVSPAFRRGFVPRYIDPILAPVAESLIDGFADRGEADLMVAFAKHYPMKVTTRLLGIPEGDEEQMARWAYLLLGYPVTDETFRAKQEFTEYLLPLIDERRADPGEDLLSRLVTEEIEGKRLTEEEILGFLRLLFPAGVDTTWLGLGTLLLAVLTHPEVIGRVSDDADERAWAVEETLRWDTPIGMEPRVTTRDIEVAGRPIPGGELVRLCLPVANRDPAKFEDPDRWDLDRRPTNHIAFGLGAHFCLGAYLARAEMAVALEVLLRRLPSVRLVEEPHMVGLVLRGPDRLLVEFDT